MVTRSDMPLSLWNAYAARASTRCRAWIIAGAFLALTSPLAAQTISQVPTSSELAALARLTPDPAEERAPLLPQALVPAQADNRYLGLAIGGVGVGILGALVANRLCWNYGSDPNGNCTGETVIGASIGAVIGGGLGYLIGMKHKKQAQAETQ